MFFNKKGSEMALNVIIIAAIALIILVVVIFIFSGKIKAFGAGVDSCGSKGGSCATGVAYTQGCIQAGTCNCPNPSEMLIQGTDCEKQSTICCKAIL